MEDGACMAHGNVSIENVGLDVLGKLENAHEIGDGGAVLADAGGDILLGEIEFVIEALIGKGLFNAIEIVALDVFDEGDFQGFGGGGITDEDGNFREAGELRCTPAAFAGKDLILSRVGGSGDEYGLEHPFFAYGVHEFLKPGVVDAVARLEWVGNEVLDRTVEELDVVIF